MFGDAGELRNTENTALRCYKEGVIACYELLARAAERINLEDSAR